MSEHDQQTGEPFSEKLRLIRFRMKREQLRFSDEIRLIPRRLVMTVIVLFGVAQIVAFVINWYGLGSNGETWPPEYSKIVASLILAGVVTAVSLGIACPLFLIGYVNRDAKRRGMNSTLWTLLVIILMPAYFATGFIIYFLVREPLPYNCPQCGSKVSARFNYCPKCKCNLRPTCPQCKREVAEGDRYCAHCAYELGKAANGGQTAPAPASNATGEGR